MEDEGTGDGRRETGDGFSRQAHGSWLTVPVLDDVVVAGDGRTGLAISRTGTVVYFQNQSRNRTGSRIVLVAPIGAEEVIDVGLQASATSLRRDFNKVAPYGAVLIKDYVTRKWSLGTALEPVLA